MLWRFLKFLLLDYVLVLFALVAGGGTLLLVVLGMIEWLGHNW